MDDYSVNGNYQERGWHEQERKREELGALSNVNDIYVDSTRSSGSIWNIRDKQCDPSANAVLSDLRTTDEIPFYAIKSVPSIEGYAEGSNDEYDPIPSPRTLSRLKSSFLQPSSSAESASTTRTSSSVITSGNHQQQQYPQCPQQSPQRQDSSSVSIGMVSEDDQLFQPIQYISSFLPPVTKKILSACSSDSGASTTITPTPLHMEIIPRPINPHHNHPNIQERFQQRKQQMEERADPKTVDEVMANELNKLSFQERETICEEIHGIDVRNAGVEESQKLLSKSFHQLDLELQKLRPQRAAFDRSQQLFGATTYLNTEELRIMFLRCDLFDVKKAANRLCDYAEVMFEIFGDVCLQRLPYITDLTDLEIQVLEAGGYQVLPGRDRAGRRILANLAFDSPKEFGVLPRLRVSMYIIMSFLRDVETQRKGAVGISWWHNVSVDDFIIRKKVHERINCIPLRLGAYHCCIPSEVESVKVDKKNKDDDEGISSGMTQFAKATVVMSVVMSIGSQLRPHLRFHTGSVVECIYALQSFGIHSDQIPVNSSSGKLKMKQHLKWLELRRLKEDSLKQHRHKFHRIIDCPRQTDVLFGRGRPIMRHPGNAVLRNVVQNKLEEYASAKSKKQTTDVTWEVVRTLKGKYGARFLKEENIENSGLGWIEVSNETARQKVRIAFRDLRTKIMKTKEKKSEIKSTIDHLGINCASGNIAKAKRKGEAGSPVTIPSAALSPTSATLTEPLEQTSSQSIQEIDSSTSVFLGMDGTDLKRQRRCF